MIAGVLAVIVLLVIRLQTPPVTWPEEIRLPDGARPLAVTRGPDWWAVVTTDERIFILDSNGTPRREISID